MNGLKDPGLSLRILLILFLLSLLGFAPRPHEADRSLRQARLAQDAGKSGAYSDHLARAAEQLPGRGDLWEMAGQAALQAGDARLAIYRLEMASAWGGLAPSGRLDLGDAFQMVGDLNRAMEIWQRELPAPGASSRLAQAHRSMQDYPAAVADLEAQLALDPANPQVLYQIGLLLAATQPESASVYLRQAADGSSDLAVLARVVDRGLRAASSVDDPAYTYLSAGRALASIGEWELAAEAFRRAAQARPDWAEAWAFLGEARQRLPSGEGADRSALDDLEKAISLGPNSVAANVFMALYWERRQRLDIALEYLTQAAASNPDNPALQAEIGNFLSEMGDLPSAQSFYERATKLAPANPVYWRMLAEFCMRHGSQIRQLALPAARQAVILSPQDPASLDVMGQVLFLLGDYANAERFLLGAIQIDPGYAPAHLHLGMNSLMQGQPSPALQQLTLAGTLAPGTPVADQAQRLLQRYFP